MTNLRRAAVLLMFAAYTWAFLSTVPPVHDDPPAPPPCVQQYSVNPPISIHCQ